ncbi:AAA family ATPase [Mesorhizobium sp. Ld1326N3]|uniref:AAA family ATPase n=1 Tax=Mesorhizobium salmacidum TaxID=3015171 RepID=A0ABU8L4M5_9HYPH
MLGVSGVGKTSKCLDYVARHPEWLYLRASALLSEATGKTTEALRTGSDMAIRDNQLLLGAALDRARTGREASPVLVDGHAVIDNDKHLVPVPVEAIAALRPDGFILLEASIEVLASRRDTAPRIRPRRSLADLARLMQAERDTVSTYAAILNLPLAHAQVEDVFQLDQLIDDLLRRVG